MQLFNKKDFWLGLCFIWILGLCFLFPKFSFADTISNCINSNPDTLGGMQNTDCVSYTDFLYSPLTVSANRERLNWISPYNQATVVRIVDVNANLYNYALDSSGLDCVYTVAFCNTAWIYISNSHQGLNETYEDGTYFFDVYMSSSNTPSPYTPFYVIDGKFYLSLSDVPVGYNSVSYHDWLLVAMIFLFFLSFQFWPKAFKFVKILFYGNRN